MRRGAGPVLVALLALTLVSVVGWGVLRDTVMLPGSDRCTAVVDGREVTLDREQAENASLIAAISVRRQMPARAASIALATAYQESGLRNLDHGDRDSLGLFQQRPSQGWGTQEQVRDPVYAANAFYDGLAEIGDYRAMPVTVAAQAVQRSGFPEAYADHEDDARVLASALTGNSRAAFACDLSARVDTASTRLTASGLTPRAEAVRADLVATFGDDLALGGYAPGGVSSGHMRGSAHYDGRAVDVFVRPISASNRQRGWAMASYLVAQADRLDVRTVIFDDRIWSRGRDDSWRDYDVPSSSGGDRRILEHRDHVHVDVFA